MGAELAAVAERLFAGVMAPLVVGGEVRPGHVIGVRTALSLAELNAPLLDAASNSLVQRMRVRRARALAPIDALGPPAAAEWTLAAAIHDLLQSTNPNFHRAFRRRLAASTLELAEATIERVPPPANVQEALSRHTWLARLFDLVRTDTAVSWWVGSRTYLGTEPPERLQAWPELRRVTVTRTARPLLQLTPLAFDGTRLAAAVAKVLACTPLTELATCVRAAPVFAWGPASAALVATTSGRTLVLRALARLPAGEVDAALGRATRDALDRSPELARAALGLLAERSIAQASGHVSGSRPTSPEAQADASFARALGAAAASRLLAVPDARWPEAERRRLLTALEPARSETLPNEPPDYSS